MSSAFDSIRGGFYRAERALRGLFGHAGALALAFALLAPACFTVPVTGRSQLNLFDATEDVAIGQQAYVSVLKESEGQLVRTGREVELVRKVVERIAAVSDDPGFEWESNVIRDPETVNAWCMPGGKIAVYTGILPICQDETGLAVVLGHEIAHAIARHGTSRMSQAVLAQIGLEAAAASNEDVAQYQAELAAAVELLVLMPFGRDDELEADHIGLIYMARAGYDPREAVAFWQRMAAAGGGAPPEFLSTHPSSEHRIAAIEALLPQAMADYEAAKKARTRK
ncbi:MAG: M48 family metallopeptidase [Planctomycetes bacterium]|nr:M48 family metallopeptidase [Planctomycetota bacterium]